MMMRMIIMIIIIIIVIVIILSTMLITILVSVIKTMITDARRQYCTLQTEEEGILSARNKLLTSPCSGHDTLAFYCQHAGGISFLPSSCSSFTYHLLSESLPAAASSAFLLILSASSSWLQGDAAVAMVTSSAACC